MRERSAGASARAASSMSWRRQRASAAITGRRTVAAICRDGLRIGRRRDREAGLDDVDAERVERAAPSAACRRHVHREAGRLLAVAQGRVEDDHRVDHRSWPVLCAVGLLEVKVIIITIKIRQSLLMPAWICTP